ncbi:MAG: response regulator transcription factor [Rubrobacter sp.]|nr:response regulator transcription factor [Rubrobacter sp.]
MKGGPRRILLAEDHASFRQALAFVFEAEAEFSVTAEAGSLEEGREVLRTAADSFDVAIVDLGLPDGEGEDLIREIYEANPRCLVLVLSASLDRTQFARAVEAGAAGVMHKSARLAQIVGAVRRLGEGESLLSQEEVIDLLRLASQSKEEEQEVRRAAESLTRREREILQAFAEGRDSKEIARQLYITVETERTHVVNILNKLGAHSRLQALIFAVRAGIVDIR